MRAKNIIVTFLILFFLSLFISTKIYADACHYQGYGQPNNDYGHWEKDWLGRKIWMKSGYCQSYQVCQNVGTTNHKCLNTTCACTNPGSSSAGSNGYNCYDWTNRNVFHGYCNLNAKDLYGRPSPEVCLGTNISRLSYPPCAVFTSAPPHAAPKVSEVKGISTQIISSGIILQNKLETLNQYALNFLATILHPNK